MCVVQQEVKFEFLGENDEEMDKNIVDNGQTYNDRVKASLTRYLNKIKYVYVPAIKDKHIFENMLERLQETVYEKKLANNDSLAETMSNLFENVIKTTEELSTEFKLATNIDSMIAMDLIPMKEILKSAGSGKNRR